LNTLAIDTATNSLELALAKDDDILAHYRGRTGTRTARVLHPILGAVLDGAGLAVDQLDLIVAIRGPGAFTGVRIGLAVAKTLSQVLGIPAIGIDTLQALAARVAPSDGDRLYAAINTFGRELYTQAFTGTAGSWCAAGPIEQRSFAELWRVAGSARVILRRVPQRAPVPIEPPAETRLVDAAVGEELAVDALRLGRRILLSDPDAMMRYPPDPIYIKPEVRAPGLGS